MSETEGKEKQAHADSKVLGGLWGGGEGRDVCMCLGSPEWLGIAREEQKEEEQEGQGKKGPGGGGA